MTSYITPIFKEHNFIKLNEDLLLTWTEEMEIHLKENDVYKMTKNYEKMIDFPQSVNLTLPPRSEKLVSKYLSTNTTCWNFQMVHMEFQGLHLTCLFYRLCVK